MRNWNGIREGSQFIEVYNDGLSIFVLDEKFILETEAYAKKLGDFDDELFLGRLESLAKKQGDCLIYELLLDDELCIEVVVGPPLSKQELSRGKWLKPQKARLNVPTGNLQVHSGNTLPLYEDSSDKPGLARVPPGQYSVLLYRLDWDKLRNSVIEAGGDWDAYEWPGPQEILVLTPATGPTKGSSLLKYPAPNNNWIGEYRLEGETLLCLAYSPYYWEELLINLDDRAIGALDLEPGKEFRIEVKDFVFEGIYIGNGDYRKLARAMWVKKFADGRPEYGIAYQPDNTVPEGEHFIVLLRIVAARPFPIHKKWLPAKFRVLPTTRKIPG